MKENNTIKLHLLFDLWDARDIRFRDADSFVDMIVQHIGDVLELTLEVIEYREDHVGNTYREIMDEIFYRQAVDPNETQLKEINSV